MAHDDSTVDPPDRAQETTDDQRPVQNEASTVGEGVAGETTDALADVRPDTETSPLGGSAPPQTDLERIGDYHLHGELARGGMGIVYVARNETLGRLVALKVLRSGEAATGRQLERFRLEARAASRLSHPHIVGIHEVGEDEGLAYLAMDLIEGSSLADRIEEQGPLDPPQAARIAEQLAQALHYAHTRGILHRDLKPRNVLLDRDGTPFLTDFGLAKEIGGDGPTITGEVLGTPSYMAPEQARGTHFDRRSDVYGLGATLYTLLVGHPPAMGKTTAEVLQRVLNDDPTPPRQLRPSLPVDLETICLKCLEKEPQRRYTSAKDLSEDLGRFLRHEPIVARPPTVGDRIAKWLTRNRRLAQVGGAALLVLLVVWAGFTVQLRGQRDEIAAQGLALKDALDASEEQRLAAQAARDEAEAKRIEAQEARADAERQSERAHAQLDLVRRAMGVLVERVHEHLGGVPGERVRRFREQAMEEAIAVHGKLLDAEVQDDPVSRRAAMAHRRLAGLLLLAGKAKPAEEEFATGADIAREVYERDPDDPLAARELCYALAGLAHVRCVRLELESAAVACEEALPLARKLASRPGATAKDGEPLLEVLMTAGDVARRRGDLPAAGEHLEEAVRFATARQKKAPDSLKDRNALSTALTEVVEVRETRGDVKGALEAAEQALTICRALVAESPENRRALEHLCLALVQVGKLRYVTGNPRQGGADYREALEVAREFARKDPTSFLARRILLVCLLRVSEFHREEEDHEQAAVLLREAAGHGRALIAHDPANHTDRGNLLSVLGSLGVIEQRAGRPKAARVALEEALKLSETSSEEQSKARRRARVITLSDLGNLLAEQGDVRGGRRRIEEAVALTRKRVASDGSNAEAQRHLAQLLQQLGRLLGRLRDPVGEERVLLESADLLRKLHRLAPEDAKTSVALLVTLSDLGVHHTLGKRPARAAAAFDEAARVKIPDSESKERLAVLIGAGDAYLALRRVPDALARFKQALEVCAKLPEKLRDQRRILCHLKMGNAHYDARNYVEAAAAYQESQRLAQVRADALGTVESHREAAIPWIQLGRVYRACWDLESASKCYGQALAIMRPLVARAPGLRQELAEFERDAAQAETIRDLLSGRRKPVSASDHVQLTNAAIVRREYAKAVERFGPLLADPAERAKHLLNAARAAALANQPELVAKALTWIEEDLALRRKRGDAAVQAHLEMLRNDRHLASLRSQPRFRALVGE